LRPESGGAKVEYRSVGLPVVERVLVYGPQVSEVGAIQKYLSGVVIALARFSQLGRTRGEELLLLEFTHFIESEVGIRLVCTHLTDSCCLQVVGHLDKSRHLCSHIL